MALRSGSVSACRRKLTTSAAALGDAHQRDVEVGESYGVRYVPYWFSKAPGRVYCLVEAASSELAAQVAEAHGLPAAETRPGPRGAVACQPNNR